MAELAIMAATSLGASAGTAATIGTVASVGLTAASAFGSIQAGNQQAAALNMQARQSTLNAGFERIEGRRQSLAIKEQLERDLSSQNALFAARGTLQGEGSSLAAQETAQRNASNDIDLALFNSDIAALNAEQRAANSRSDAKAAKKSGIMDAVGTVAGFKLPAGVGGGIENMAGQAKTKTALQGAMKRKPTLLAGL